MKLFNCTQTNDYMRIISVSNTWNYLTVYKQMIILEIISVSNKLFNCMQTNDYIRIITVSHTWNYLTVCKQMIILELLLLVILETI